MRPLTVLCLVAGCAGQPHPGGGSLESMLVPLEVDELPAAVRDAGEPRFPPQPVPTPLQADDPAAPEPKQTLMPDGSSEQITQTLDCPDGGVVQVHVRRQRKPSPYERNGQLTWTYDECGTWQYGTIDGRASFSRVVGGGPPWERSMNYHADLEYGGREDGQCNAYVQLTQKWQDSNNRMQLPTTCPHPVEEWWGQLGF